MEEKTIRTCPEWCGILPDFTLKVGDKRYPTHKSLLMMTSKMIFIALEKDKECEMLPLSDENKTSCTIHTFLRMLHPGEIFIKDSLFPLIHFVEFCNYMMCDTFKCENLLLKETFTSGEELVALFNISKKLHFKTLENSLIDQCKLQKNYQIVFNYADRLPKDIFLILWKTIMKEKDKKIDSKDEFSLLTKEGTNIEIVKIDDKGKYYWNVGKIDCSHSSKIRISFGTSVKGIGIYALEYFPAVLFYAYDNKIFTFERDQYHKIPENIDSIYKEMVNIHERLS
jgi:hypothetical protein